MINFRRIDKFTQAKYQSWKSDTIYGRKLWLQRAEEAEEFYLSDVDQTGTTLTSTQFGRVVETTNMGFSVNILYPIINQELGILNQVKSSMRVISLDGRAKNHAALLDKMKHAVLYNSKADIEIESLVYSSGNYH